MAPTRCLYCGKRFPTPRAVNHHISASKSCSKKRLNHLIRKDEALASPSPKRQKMESVYEFEGGSDGNLDVIENEMRIGDDFVIVSAPRMASVEPRDEGGSSENTYPRNERFIESFQGEAGIGLRKSKTLYETWFENQKKEGKIPWFPFASEQEWTLAKWLLNNVGHKSTDEFLKLPIVSDICEAFERSDSLKFLRLIARKTCRSTIPTPF